MGLGGIVFVLHPRGADHRIFCNAVKNRRVHLQLSQYGTQLFRRHRPWAKEPWHRGTEGQHRGLHPHLAGTSIQDGIHPSPQVVDTVLGGGGTGTAGQICRRSRNGNSCKANHFPCHRMTGHTNGHRIQSPRCGPWDPRTFWQDHGHGSWPIGIRQGFGRRGNLGHQRFQLLPLADMNDQRVILGTAFGQIDPLNRLLQKCIGPQAIDRLGGQGHQFSLAQQLSRPLKVLGILCIQQHRIRHENPSLTPQNWL